MTVILKVPFRVSGNTPKYRGCVPVPRHIRMHRALVPPLSSAGGRPVSQLTPTGSRRPTWTDYSACADR